MYLFKSKKSPFYQIAYDRNGKTSSISTKTKIKSEALKFLSEFERNSKKEIILDSISLEKFKTKYLDYLSEIKSKNYYNNVKVAFTQLFLFLDQTKLLNDITVKEMDLFISRVYQKAPQSAISYYRIIKAAFNKAILWNYISINPLNKIEVPKIKKSFPAFIKEFELFQILEQTKESFLRDLFLFAFHTGMRESEIINLEWSSINLNERIITVSNTKSFTTKSKKERIIPINKTVYEVLLNRLQHKRKDNFSITSSIPEYVFSRIIGVKLNLDFVSKKFKKAVRTAKLNDKIHFHTLRHSFASNLVQRGVSLFVVKELLGHSDLRVTQIYSHLQHTDLFNAVDLLAS